MFIRKDYTITFRDNHGSVIFKKFGDSSPAFEYSEESSEDQHIGTDSTKYVYFDLTKTSPVRICLMTDDLHESRWQLVNILSKDKSELSIEEHNNLADEFILHLEAYLDRSRIKFKASKVLLILV